MRNVLAILFSTLFFVQSCDFKEDETVLLTKRWKASELELAGQKISGNDLPLIYEFRADNTFIKIEGEGESAIKESGTWELNDTERKIRLNYNEAKTEVVFDIEELSDSKLVLSGEENTIKKRLILVPVIE